MWTYRTYIIDLFSCIIIQVENTFCDTPLDHMRLMQLKIQIIKRLRNFSKAQNGNILIKYMIQIFIQKGCSKSSFLKTEIYGIKTTLTTSQELYFLSQNWNFFECVGRPYVRTPCFCIGKNDTFKLFSFLWFSAKLWIIVRN